MKPKDSYELKFQLLSPKCILSASLFRKKESLSPSSAPSESQTQEYPLPMRRLLLLHLRLKQHMETPTLPVDNRLNVFSQFGRWHNGTVSTIAQLESLLAKSNFTWLDSHVQLETRTKVNNGLGQRLMVPVSISFYLSSLVLPWKDPPTDNTHIHTHAQDNLYLSLGIYMRIQMNYLKVCKKKNFLIYDPVYFCGENKDWGWKFWCL